MPRFALIMAVLLAFALDATADRSPIRRGADKGESRRRGIDDDRSERREIEDGAALERKRLEEQKQREITKVINLITPPRCGSRSAPKFKRALLALTSPEQTFDIEVWGNKRTYYTMDSIFYFLRANEKAFVTMFWIGPEGSVFVPFANLPVQAARNHMIDPKNIIVEPVGLERWRVIATPEPHFFPCRGTDQDFVSALNRVRQGKWAAARWDVMSKVRRRNRLRRRRIR